MIDADKKTIITTVKKAWGTIKKIESMLEEGIYCANVAQQINAAIGLLKQANNKLEVDDFVKELIRVWDVSTRK